MRKSFFIIAFLVAFTTLYAQETSPVLTAGDMVILGPPMGSEYTYLDFPKKNIIIKRGGIANFNRLIGQELVVERTATNKNGNMEAVLKRKDGLKFFRFFPTITGNVRDALAAGELRTVN